MDQANQFRKCPEDYSIMETIISCRSKIVQNSIITQEEIYYRADNPLNFSLASTDQQAMQLGIDFLCEPQRNTKK